MALHQGHIDHQRLRFSRNHEPVEQQGVQFFPCVLPAISRYDRADARPAARIATVHAGVRGFTRDFCLRGLDARPGAIARVASRSPPSPL